MDSGPNITHELLERIAIVLDSMNPKQKVKSIENQELKTFRKNNPQEFKGGFNLILMELNHP